MPERAIFLDRDNTIIDNDGYLGDPARVRLLPGAATALAALRSLGYRLIVVSNQSGVARGMFDEAAVEAVNNEMSRQLRQQAGAYVDASYYCPFHPDAPLPDYRIDHDWRKPKPGMLKQAAVDFSLDLAGCWMIGDQPRDIAAGAAAGCRTILLRDGDKAAVPPADAENTRLNASPNFVVKTLADAARILAREGRHGPVPTRTDIAASLPAVPSSSGQVSPPELPPPPPPRPTSIADAARKPAAPPASVSAAPSSPQIAAAGAAPAGHHLEKQLEELVTHLRHQSRNADLHPDFSFSSIAVLILQILAFAALLLGLFRFFSAPATFTNDLATAKAIIAVLNSIFWLLAAATLQGTVIALLLHSRHK